jgi:phosphohistidine phosphatase
MVKHLYLIRHAEAVEKKSYQADKDRELTPVGVEQSVQIGAYFLRENIPVDIIYSSTAERARQTAILASDMLKFDTSKIIFDDELYDASVRTFFQFINKLDSSNHNVMCVGHNPTLSYLAEYLTKAEIGDIPASGVIGMRFNIHSWGEISEGTAELLYQIHPEMMAKKGS